MVDADFLDTLEYIARKVRRNEEPFGGIQLIFSGEPTPVGPALAAFNVLFQQRRRTIFVPAPAINWWLCLLSSGRNFVCSEK